MSNTRGPQVYGVSYLFLGLTSIFTILRIYCKLAIVKYFRVDDYLAVIAQLLFMFVCASAITGTRYGTGQHIGEILPLSNIPIALKWWWVSELAYILSSLAVKFSIYTFLLRIIVSKTQTAVLWAVTAISGVFCTYFFFLFVFQCRPVTYFWAQYSGMQGSCINPRVITASIYAYSAVSCWSDWTCCILPMFAVWNLQMNPRTKISVCLIFALCAVASTATIIRIPFIHGLLDTRDFLYATADVALWSITETGLAITASAAATLQPLFRNFLSRSRLFGGSTKEISNVWPSPMKGEGYSKHCGFDETRLGSLSMRQPRDSVVTIVAASSDLNTKQSKNLDDSRTERFGSASASASRIRKTVKISVYRSENADRDAGMEATRSESLADGAV